MTQVPSAVQNQVMITFDELYRQKGEVMTQLEICQAKIQMINQQLQQLLNQQAIPAK